MNEISLSMQNKVTKVFLFQKFSCKVCVGFFGPPMTTTGSTGLRDKNACTFNAFTQIYCHIGIQKLGKRWFVKNFCYWMGMNLVAAWKKIIITRLVES